MTLLITGGAGFIGSNFILYLREKYPAYRLLCLDKLTYAADRTYLTPLEEDSNFRFIQGDICDGAMLDELFAQEPIDGVINFAAESHVDRSIEDAAPFIKTNVLGVQALLEACRRHGVARFHQISTDEVYGDLPIDAPAATEQSPLRPSNPYSASKASADLLALSYRRTYGMEITISRCSNNYGPHQHSEKFIPAMIACARAGRPLPLYGDGMQIRDWLYVWDHCAAVDAIFHRGRSGEIYNIGASCEQPNRAMAERILALLGKRPDQIGFIGDRLGHDRRYALDWQKIKNELGWRPQTTMEAGLEKTLQWYYRVSN